MINTKNHLLQVCDFDMRVHFHHALNATPNLQWFDQMWSISGNAIPLENKHIWTCLLPALEAVLRQSAYRIKCIWNHLNHHSRQSIMCLFANRPPETRDELTCETVNESNFRRPFTGYATAFAAIKITESAIVSLIFFFILIICLLSYSRHNCRCKYAKNKFILKILSVGQHLLLQACSFSQRGLHYYDDYYLKLKSSFRLEKKQRKTSLKMAIKSLQLLV